MTPNCLFCPGRRERSQGQHGGGAEPSRGAEPSHSPAPWTPLGCSQRPPGAAQTRGSRAERCFSASEVHVGPGRILFIICLEECNQDKRAPCLMIQAWHLVVFHVCDDCWGSAPLHSRDHAGLQVLVPSWAVPPALKDFHSPS